jgi:hypothetical protein
MRIVGQVYQGIAFNVYEHLFGFSFLMNDKTEIH